jgi:hypothetical protein
MSPIVDFYRGDKPDYLGRSLRDIWQWDNVRLGLPNHARAFFECLAEIHSEFARDIGPETLAYWRNAAPSASL